MDSFFSFFLFLVRRENGRMGRKMGRQVATPEVHSKLVDPIPSNLCRGTFEADAAPSSLLLLPLPLPHHLPPAMSRRPQRRLPSPSPHVVRDSTTSPSSPHEQIPVTKQNFQTIRHFPISSRPIVTPRSFEPASITIARLVSVSSRSNLRPCPRISPC